MCFLNVLQKQFIFIENTNFPVDVMYFFKHTVWIIQVRFNNTLQYQLKKLLYFVLFYPMKP